MSRDAEATGAFIVLSVAILGLGLWIANIVGFVRCDFSSPYKCEIVRGVAIVVPVVSFITPFMDLEDGQKN